jgi:hypothetical protein
MHGGGIHNPGGNIVAFYAWDLGNVSNNIVEACALLESLRLHPSSSMLAVFLIC